MGQRSKGLPKPPAADQAGRQGPVSLQGGSSHSTIPCRFLLVLPWVWDASPGTAFCPRLPRGTHPPCRPVGGGTAPCHCQESEASSHPCHGSPRVPHSLCLGRPLCRGLGEGPLNLPLGPDGLLSSSCGPYPAAGAAITHAISAPGNMSSSTGSWAEAAGTWPQVSLRPRHGPPPRWPRSTTRLAGATLAAKF